MSFVTTHTSGMTQAGFMVLILKKLGFSINVKLSYQRECVYRIHLHICLHVHTFAYLSCVCRHTSRTIFTCMQTKCLLYVPYVFKYVQPFSSNMNHVSKHSKIELHNAIYCGYIYISLNFKPPTPTDLFEFHIFYKKNASLMTRSSC